jgi:PAS domain-containing protein
LPWAQLLQPAACDLAAVQQLGTAIAAGEAAQADMSCGWLRGRISVNPLTPAGGAGGSPSAAPQLLLCTLLPGHPGATTAAAALAAGTSVGASAPAGPHDVLGVPGAQSLSQLCNQALASTSESVVITDPNQPGNPIIYANQAFERLTGAPRAAAPSVPLPPARRSTAPWPCSAGVAAACAPPLPP